MILEVAISLADAGPSPQAWVILSRSENRVDLAQMFVDEWSSNQSRWTSWSFF